MPIDCKVLPEMTRTRSNECMYRRMKSITITPLMKDVDLQLKTWGMST